MHYFIFPTKDTFISSGSNTSTTGDSERDQNFGQDSILEINPSFGKMETKLDASQNFNLIKSTIL